MQALEPPPLAPDNVEPPPVPADAVEANAEDDFPPDLEASSAPVPVDAATQMALDIGAAMELDKAAKQATTAALSSLPTPLKAEQAERAGQAVPAPRSTSPCYPPTSPYFLPLPPQAKCEGVSATARTFPLPLGSFIESYVVGMDKSPEDVFPEERLREEIEVLRGTKDDPKHRVDLAAYGVATGKWSGAQAYNNARRDITTALEFKNSGECDDSACKHDQTGKHMLCKTDLKVVESTHAGNGSVSYFI